MKRLIIALALAAAGPQIQAAPRMRYDRWFNHYHDSVVYKTFMKSKGAAPDTTLDQALALIRRIHDYSGGLHQVVYLVGWQFDGHDSKYPDWSEVGPQCRSSLSDDPLTSLRLAMQEARKYNADLSLHVNMNDAYTNAPSWKTYEANDLFCRHKDGGIVRGGRWGGEWSYRISHVKEFRKGFAQKRILGLLEMLPDLKRSGTIHIDALFGQKSDYEGVSALDDFRAIVDIVDFWHAQGVDVTTEFLGRRDQVGVFPMCYHLNMDEQMHLEIPPEVLCGGDDAWNTRHGSDYYDNRRAWMGVVPTPGSAYEEAWGVGSTRGDLNGGLLRDPHGLVARLFRTAFLFCYYNRSRAVRHWADAEHYVVERADGVVADVRKADRHLTVTDNGRLVLDGGDCLLDLPHGGGTLLAFSEKGCDRVFTLPKAHADAKLLKGTRWPEGTAVELSVVDGQVKVVLPARSSLTLRR